MAKVEKAEIVITEKWEKYIDAESRAKFAQIYTSDCQWSNIEFKRPHNNLISIVLINPEEIGALDLHLAAVREYNELTKPVQTYIIFSEDYGHLKKRIAPYRALPNAKLLFINSPENAVRYGLGLLEKAAKYGIWGTLA